MVDERDDIRFIRIILHYNGDDGKSGKRASMRAVKITVVLDESVAERAQSLGVLDEKTLAWLVEVETKRRQWQKMKEDLASGRQSLQSEFTTEEAFMAFLDDPENEDGKA